MDLLYDNLTNKYRRVARGSNLKGRRYTRKVSGKGVSMSAYESNDNSLPSTPSVKVTTNFGKNLLERDVNGGMVGRQGRTGGPYVVGINPKVIPFANPADIRKGREDNPIAKRLKGASVSKSPEGIMKEIEKSFSSFKITPKKGKKTIKGGMLNMI